MTSMKSFKKISRPGCLLSVGIFFILFGLFVIIKCKDASIPEDYNINAFDAIFVFPSLVKVIYYDFLRAVIKFGSGLGWVCLIGGAVCIVPVIPALPKIFKGITECASKGDKPTDDELRTMLESGELTQDEYDEISSYLNRKK